MVGDNRSRRWIDAWAAVLDDGPQRVRSALLDQSEHGHDLRQMSPLADLISDQERLAALAAADFLELSSSVVGMGSPAGTRR